MAKKSKKKAAPKKSIMPAKSAKRTGKTKKGKC